MPSYTLTDVRCGRLLKLLKKCSKIAATHADSDMNTTVVAAIDAIHTDLLTAGMIAD